MAGKSHAAKMLEALSDGRRWSTHELVEFGCGYAAHSRASDLRKLGYAVKNTRAQTRDGSDVYWYELQSVPPESSRLEAVIDPLAAARVQAMRRSTAADASSPVGQEAESGAAPGQGEPEQAIDASSTTALPLPRPAAVDPSSAAGAPSPKEKWIDHLSGELSSIDDEISALRSQLFLSDGDSSRVELLLARGAEVTRRLDELGERAAA